MRRAVWRPSAMGVDTARKPAKKIRYYASYERRKVGVGSVPIRGQGDRDIILEWVDMVMKERFVLRPRRMR
jgi:hypothetical protein